MTPTSNSDILTAAGKERWYLRLYVAGQSTKSLQAIANLERLCEEHLAGRYEIEVVDLVEHPSLAPADDIIAIPPWCVTFRRRPARWSETSPTPSAFSSACNSGPRRDDRADPWPRWATARRAPPSAQYDLTLFVSGASDLSARAVADARSLCEAHLEGRYRLSVVDVNDDAAIVDSRVTVTPRLVRYQPLPVRTIVGDLSRTDGVLLALDLPAARGAPRAGS